MPAPVLTQIEEIPRDMARGFQGGPVFDTVVHGVAGHEARIERPRARWVFEQREVGRTIEGMKALEAFFLGKRGSSRPFLLWDPQDHTIETPEETLPLSATTFQVAKRYVFQTFVYTREIYFLVAGTVRVFNGLVGEVTTGFTVGLNTGIITFTSAPSFIPLVTCDFLVPVRLDGESWERDFRYPNWAWVSECRLVEAWN